MTSATYSEGSRSPPRNPLVGDCHHRFLITTRSVQRGRDKRGSVHEESSLLSNAEARLRPRVKPPAMILFVAALAYLV